MKKFRIDYSYLISLFLSISIALIIGGILIVTTGHNPIDGYSAMLDGVFGNIRVLGNTISKSLNLCLTALAMAVAAKTGMFNVGGEGQLYLGGLAATIVGVTMAGAPVFIVIPIALIVGAIVGGAFAWIPGWLRVRFNVSEVITTIMLNSAAIFLCKFLVNGPLKTTEKGVLSATENVFTYKMTQLIPASNLTTALFYSAAIALAVWYVMGKTSLGLEMKVTGENPRFSNFVGLKSDKMMICSMVVSGAICGVVGMMEVYGIQGRFTENISNEFYFDGMLLAMIMNYNPFGIIAMSFFFGVLKIGASAMELSTGISGEISQIIFAIIIFLMAAQGGFKMYFASLSLKYKGGKNNE
ncbi:ABC transporter permease [Eubacteriales bacterium KG127]